MTVDRNGARLPVSRHFHGGFCARWQKKIVKVISISMQMLSEKVVYC